MKLATSTIRLLAVVGVLSLTATTSGAFLLLHRSACHTNHSDCAPSHENESLPEQRHDHCQICHVLKSLTDKCLNDAVENAGVFLEPISTDKTYTAITTGCFVPRPVIPRGPPAA